MVVLERVLSENIIRETTVDNRINSFKCGQVRAKPKWDEYVPLVGLFYIAPKHKAEGRPTILEPEQ